MLIVKRNHIILYFLSMILNIFFENKFQVFQKLQDKDVQRELDSLNSICTYNYSSFIAKIQAYSKLLTSLQAV